MRVDKPVKEVVILLTQEVFQIFKNNQAIKPKKNRFKFYNKKIFEDSD